MKPSRRQLMGGIIGGFLGWFVAPRRQAEQKPASTPQLPLTRTITTFTYDASKSLFRDPRNVTTTIYDAAGRMIMQYDPKITTFCYNSNPK